MFEEKNITAAQERRHTLAVQNRGKNLALRLLTKTLTFQRTINSRKFTPTIGKKTHLEYLRNTNGGMAVFFVISLSVILLATAIAIEANDLHKTQRKSQDLADVAVLATAQHIALNLQHTDSRQDKKKYEKEALKLGNMMLSELTQETMIRSIDPDLRVKNGHVTLELGVIKHSIMMNIFGRDKFPIAVRSAVAIPIFQPQDIDLILITDATGSMQDEIESVQNYLSNFPNDLQEELDVSGIKIGSIRTKYIFYRDYFVDSVSAAPSRFDTPPESWAGAMFESPFYRYPSERPQMQSYVDQFTAGQGGDDAESGLEAILHAVNTSGWRPAESTVRIIVLWTDAPANIPHEFLPADENIQDGWIRGYDDWVERVGQTFADLNIDDRSQYFYDNFYPATEIPTTMADVKTKLENFHQNNTGTQSDQGVRNLISISLHVTDSCLDEDDAARICKPWEEMSEWDGVSLTKEPRGMNSLQTYQNTIKGIAQAAKTQLTVRELSIVY